MCEKCAELCAQRAYEEANRSDPVEVPNRSVPWVEARKHRPTLEHWLRIARAVRRAGRPSACPDAVKAGTQAILKICNPRAVSEIAAMYFSEEALRAAEDVAFWEGQCEEYVTTHGHDGHGAEAAITRTSRCMHNRPCPVHAKQSKEA